MYFLFKTEAKKPQALKIHFCGQGKTVYRKVVMKFCAQGCADELLIWGTSQKDVQRKNETEGKNKTYHNPISFVPSKTSLCLLFLAYADFTSTITYQINGKFRASKSLRTSAKGQTSSWERKEEILGKRMLLKPYFWSMMMHQPWCDSLTNSTTPATTIGDVPLTLRRSNNTQRAARQGTALLWMSPAPQRVAKRSWGFPPW